MKKSLVPSIAIAVLILAAAQSAHAATGNRCSIEPFGTFVKQGEKASVIVNIKVDSPKDLVDLKMGNLPLFVEGGFEKGQTVSADGLTKRSKILINATLSAQTGSFMMPIEYTVNDGKSAVCQFNLVIAKNVPQVKSQLAATSTSASIESQISSSTTNKGFFQRIWAWVASHFKKNK